MIRNAGLQLEAHPAGKGRGGSYLISRGHLNLISEASNYYTSRSWDRHFWLYRLPAYDICNAVYHLARACSKSHLRYIYDCPQTPIASLPERFSGSDHHNQGGAECHTDIPTLRSQQAPIAGGPTLGIFLYLVGRPSAVGTKANKGRDWLRNRQQEQLIRPRGSQFRSVGGCASVNFHGRAEFTPFNSVSMDGDSTSRRWETKLLVKNQTRRTASHSFYASCSKAEKPQSIV